MIKNPPRDRYEPPTGYKVGEKVRVIAGNRYVNLTGTVIGFGNPGSNKGLPHVRVSFPNEHKRYGWKPLPFIPFTFPVAHIERVS